MTVALHVRYLGEELLPDKKLRQSWLSHVSFIIPHWRVHSRIFRYVGGGTSDLMNESFCSRRFTRKTDGTSTVHTLSGLIGCTFLVNLSGTLMYVLYSLFLSLEGPVGGRRGGREGGLTSRGRYYIYNISNRYI